MLREQLNGIQHVGIPTNDIETTVEFYKIRGKDISCPFFYLLALRSQKTPSS